MIGEFCIIRCRDAGVHCGVVVSVFGRAVELAEARRLWNWQGDRNTLNEIALRGADVARISEEVAKILLLDACEVLPCTPEAEENLRQSRWDEPYKPSAPTRRAAKKTA